MDDFIDSRITLAIFIHAICKSVECDVRSSPPSWTSVSTHESEIPYSINGQSLDPKQRHEIGAPSMSIKDDLEKEGRGAKLRYLRRGTTGGLKHRSPNYR